MIEHIFQSQRTNQGRVASTTCRHRQDKLKGLHQVVLSQRSAIREALYQDFRKHPSEVDLTEIYPVTTAIQHTVRHLAQWMRPQPVGTPLALTGSRSYIHHEPKGQALIISPWNFPFTLTLGPLVSAVAAGNCVMLKPSELTPHASELLKKMVAQCFDENEVAVLTGDLEVSQALLTLPFHHIFFTGAPNIGKLVMKAAAEHLASVTLELGGKSPTIVDDTANLATAARRIAWAKWVNNGQICIAPDYVFVHEDRKDRFLEAVQANLRSLYGPDPRRSPSYARIVNQRHLGRLAGYLDQARSRGARVVAGGAVEADERFIAPTVLTDVDPDCDLMTQEIFGPILPVFGFRELDEPIQFIGERDKPLALYIYSRSQPNIDYLVSRTRAGGTCINHNAVHFFNQNLPFGGSNHSGIGKAHGFAGFQAFSNPRSIYRQASSFSPIELMMPPYGWLKQKLIDLTIRWL